MKKKTVKIVPVKNFYDKSNGYILRAAGVPFDTTPERAKDLTDKGLVEIVVTPFTDDAKTPYNTDAVVIDESDAE